MRTATIKNWAEFQHYKDRSPPWLKIHRGLLDDYEFQSLPIASKALAPMLWLIASEADKGVFRVDIEFLAFRLRWPNDQVEEGLKPLISKGFVVLDSSPLAECSQTACLEGETEGETEGEKAPRKRKRSDELTLSDWVLSLPETEEIISEDDGIYEWAEKQQIPRTWIALAWSSFEARYVDKRKKYSDWRRVFRTAVREDWLRLWRADPGGRGWTLTTAGEMAQREMQS